MNNLFDERLVKNVFGKCLKTLVYAKKISKHKRGILSSLTVPNL